VTNSRGAKTTLVLEPWGETYEMPEDSAVDITAAGPLGDTLEVTLAVDSVAVWAWPGAVVQVFHGDEELGNGRTRPAVPGGEPQSPHASPPNPRADKSKKSRKG